MEGYRQFAPKSPEKVTGSFVDPTLFLELNATLFLRVTIRPKYKMSAENVLRSQIVNQTEIH